MICKKCNKENPDNNVVCDFCGNVLIDVPDNPYHLKFNTNKKTNNDNKMEQPKEEGSFFRRLEKKIFSKYTSEEDEDDYIEVDNDDDSDIDYDEY